MKKISLFLVIGIIPVLLVFALITIFSSNSTIDAKSEPESKEEAIKEKPAAGSPKTEPADNNSQDSDSNTVITEQNQPQKVAEQTKEQPFTVAFAGDTMFDWGLRPVLEEKGYAYPFEHVKSDLQQADYTVVNLETAVTERTEKTAGQLYWIKSDQRSLQALRNSGVDMVNLGNNHMLDYGTNGLLDTIDAVKSNGFEYIGAGKNEAEAYQAKVVEINNQTVAFLSFTRFFPSASWAASSSKPGVTNGYDLNFVISKIKEQQEKANADYFIVNFHWGVEKTNTPAPYQRDYVKRIVEETKTDAIIGSHPHWLQGFEYYQDVPVAYSLGNFLFPDYVSGHAAETGVYNLTFDNGEISASFNPYVIQDNQIQPLTGEKQQAIYQYLDGISINAGVDQNGNITQKN